MPRRWTKREILDLYSQIGSAGDAKLGRVFKHRSLTAIRAKAWRVFGTTSRTRGTYSLDEVKRETGYSRTQLLRAQKALRQRWQRTRRGGVFMITLDQVQEMSDWLKGDYWCVKYGIYSCAWCGMSDRPHSFRGLCVSCGTKYRRLCLAAGLPSSHSELYQYLVSSRRLSRRVSLVSLKVRLESGLALTRRQLSELIRLCNASI